MKYFSLALFLSAAIATPSFATVTVSSPVAGSKVTSPVHYVATATAPSCSKGVAAMGIYVDNKLVYTVHKNELNTEIKLAAGVENTVVQEWDKCGGPSTYTKVKLTVTAAASGPTVSIVADPTFIAPGGSSTLTVTAADATGVVIAGS